MPLVLVTGGIRSGKSEVAERLAGEGGAPVTYVATGTASDPEMGERIERHRARRPAGWRTVETGDPAAALTGVSEGTVLLDSLGGWVARLLHEHGLLGDAPVDELALANLRARVRALAEAAAGRPGLTVVVTEEAGLGPVPGDAGTRRWLDLAAEAAQLVGGAADRALLVVAGRALELTEPERLVEPPELAGLRRHGDTMIPPGAEDFAVNVEAGGPPDWLRAELLGALERSDRYPDERAAREAVARRHDRPWEEVVIANGAAEAFWLLGAALRPRHAVCVHPSFTEPEAALRAHGHPVARAFRRAGDFALEPSAIPDGADLVVLGNPNNPSGGLDRARDVGALCRPGRVTVVDEAFMDFVPHERQSVAARRDLPGLVVVRSLTKAWSLPGVRGGYLLAPAPLAARLCRLRPAWNANALALAALRACSERAAELRTVAERVAAARQRLAAALAELPAVRTWPSAANFLLVEVPDGAGVHRRLLERRIAVRPGWTFPGLGAGHLRVTVRDMAANDRLVSALAEALA